ncbi:MAG: hypothetical protein J0M33_27595 [Anaerolineae bacterium]|nr:hypothetical protein [Anaerolineae bacterium]
MSKPTIIPNWHYQKPSKGGYRSLRKLLKYVSYRESPDHRPVDLSDRWTDCGLGAGWKAVYEGAGQQAGPYVLAHHLVIAPAPDLMALVPESIRAEMVREVTERTIEGWHVARGLNIPDYSYVLHDRDTDDEFGLQMLHTHVFVAGTIENSLGERESHMTHRGQVCTDRGGLNREDNLHRIARQEFELVLDRTIGQEWRRTRELEQPEVEMDRSGGVEHDIDF